MASHVAVVTPGVRQPLATLQRPTRAPETGEIRVRVMWTASTPLDLHQADGGLLVTPPQVLGDGLAGVVVQLGENVQNLAIGDKVFGFAYRTNDEKAHQEFVTLSSWLVGKIPSNIPMQAAVTVPNNLVTVWHLFGADLGIHLPFPKPEHYAAPDHDYPVLVWGGATSVGQYAIQLLRHYGYTRVVATASPRHHELLKKLGATECVDYNAMDAVGILKRTLGDAPVKVLDCVGDAEGSVRPIAEIVSTGSVVAVALPVIVRHASEQDAPEYTMDTTSVASWPAGVDVRGVRTHFYPNNEWNKTHLQPEVMPALLASGAIAPNAYRIVEGATLLDRAQKALDSLRRKEPRGERLVWRVSEIGESQA